MIYNAINDDRTIDGGGEDMILAGRDRILRQHWRRQLTAVLENGIIRT